MADGRATAARAGETQERTPAQVYSVLFGATLVLAGVLGFFVNTDFDVGTGVQGDDLILFEVNAWHNLVHIVSGLLGLGLARKASTARVFALGFGTVYLVVTVWGFIAEDNILFGLAPTNPADNLLHLLIAVAGIGAGLGSPPASRTPEDLAR